MKGLRRQSKSGIPLLTSREGNDNDLASKALASVGYLCLKEGTGERALSALNKAINLKPDFDEGLQYSWCGEELPWKTSECYC